MTEMIIIDECDPLLPHEDRRFVYVETEDPYAGLNRQQRRKAMSVENRAERKKKKNHG